MSVELLKKAYEYYGSQRKVGEMLGKSATTVNLLLKGKYPNPEPILRKVKESFIHLQEEKYECPVLGTIHSDVCRRYKTWAKIGVIKKDRLYLQVKEQCLECNYAKEQK